MVYQVTWSSRALDDLKNVVEHIREDNPVAAERFGQRLVDAAESLARLPERGRLIPKFMDPTLRDILVGPYRVAYRITHEPVPKVQIARLWHGAREPDSYTF